MPRLRMETGTKPCKQCGQLFERTPRQSLKWWSVAKYCGVTCMQAARKPPPKTCDHCDKTITVELGQSAKRRRFCSIMCANHSRSVDPMTTRYRRVTSNGKKMLEHRAVMEKATGRLLRPCEAVHHKDGDKLNNSLENLELMQMSDHSRMHMMGNQNAKRS